MLRSRQPAGTPTGGQFAATARPEAGVRLEGRWSSVRAGVAPDRALVGREMRGKQSVHGRSRDPFLRGASDGARLAADCLNDPADHTDTLMRLAREYVGESVNEEIMATSGRGTAREQDRHADMADLHAGRAHALLFAAHRVAQPDKGADWADRRAREDAATLRHRSNPPEPARLWRRVRRSLRRLGGRA